MGKTAAKRTIRRTEREGVDGTVFNASCARGGNADVTARGGSGAWLNEVSPPTPPRALGAEEHAMREAENLQTRKRILQGPDTDDPKHHDRDSRRGSPRNLQEGGILLSGLKGADEFPNQKGRKDPPAEQEGQGRTTVGG